MGGNGSGRHSIETQEEAWLSGCIYTVQQVVREDARRYSADKAELARLQSLAQGEAA